MVVDGLDHRSIAGRMSNFKIFGCHAGSSFTE